MMFALALGIDYALFVVVRYRAARMGAHETKKQSIAETTDTAGKAVLLSGLTVLVALSAVMLVPSPSFRSMAGGIMLSVIFVLGATLIPLPLLLFKLDNKIDKCALPWVYTGEHRSAKFAAWGERLWRRPVAWGPGLPGHAAGAHRASSGPRTAMPSIEVLPEDASACSGYAIVQDKIGEGAPGTLQIVTDRADERAAAQVLERDAGIVAAMPPMPAGDGPGFTVIRAVPSVDPADPELAETVDRLRAELPESALVGGAAVENLDLKTLLDESTPLAIGVVLALGFLLLLVALQAPLIAMLGTPGSLAHSGRVMFAAGAVMVAVFFTFALSGPLPPKEMGIVLGVAVLLDAALVRLVLLPVLLRLTGKAARYAPTWLKKVLPSITFAHN